jgi:arylformamidase
MTAIYDITIPVHDGLAVWPGDTPYRFALGWDMREGAAVNVGAVTMSAHTGTHVDAPFHFAPDGAGVDTLDPSVFVGPVAVVDATGRETIGRDVFAGVDFASTPRVLVRTGVWSDYTRFPQAVPTLTDDVPAFLGANGVRLFGIDVPSVDAIDSKTLPNHHALAVHGITILESADLRAVPTGVYTLIALPLRLVGADASPVRAILTTP